MSKVSARAEAETAKRTSRGFKFVAYSPGLNLSSAGPRQNERTTNPWVKFGDTNQYLENLRLLADKCSPLNRCIELTASMIAGQDIVFYDKSEKPIPEARDRFISWLGTVGLEDFLLATANDIALANAKCWVVRRSETGDITNLDHLDVSRLRSGYVQSDEESGENTVVDFYWSSDWSRVGSRGGAPKGYAPQPLKVYDDKKRVSRSVIYTRVYKQNRDYYSEPWFVATIPDCEVWAQVPEFNNVQIATGFKSSVHLHTYIGADVKDLEQYDKDIEDAYTGPTARGLFHTFGLQGEAAPVITPIPRGDHAGELDAIREKAEKVIVRGYGLPDILYNMDAAGGLTSVGSALTIARQQYLSSFIRAKQPMITRDAVRLLKDSGMANVHSAAIVNAPSGEDIKEDTGIRLRVMTINDLRKDLKLPELTDGRGDLIPGLISPALSEDLTVPPPATKPNTGNTVA